MTEALATATDDELMVKLSIYQDTDSESPRDWDNLGTMVCWSRYYLGDTNPFSTPTDFQEFVDDEPGIVYLPLYLYDHSGISMSTGGFVDRWDSGQVGWIFVTRDELAEEYADVPDDATIRSYLEGEVETYDQYLRGAVYGFVLESIEPDGDDGYGAFVGNGETIESVWGFYGDDFLHNGMADHVSDKYRHLFGEVG